MKTAMISQPMRGKTKEEILAVRDEAKKELASMGYDALDTYYGVDFPWFVKSNALYCLGQSLMDMACCDVVYFCSGWEDARGCRIEHEAAKDYGIDIIYETEAEELGKKNTTAAKRAASSIIASRNAASAKSPISILIKSLTKPISPKALRRTGLQKLPLLRRMAKKHCMNTRAETKAKE